MLFVLLKRVREKDQFLEFRINWYFGLNLCLVVNGIDVLDQVDNTATVTELIVVP